MPPITLNQEGFERYLKLLKDSVKTKEQRQCINRRYYAKRFKCGGDMTTAQRETVEERKEKRREYSKKYYQKNKEAILLRNKMRRSLKV